MDNGRTVVWYGIVSYFSDIIKGEILNVGLMINTPKNGELNFTLLSEGNSKLKSLITNKRDKEIYKSGKKYLDYLIESIDNNNLGLPITPAKKDFISTFSTLNLPKGYRISTPRYAKVSDVNLFIDNLKSIYIGESFLNEEMGTNSMIVKRKAMSIIGTRERALKKIKKNIQIKPVANLPKNYTLDFGYTENNKLSLIDSTPDRLSTAYDWLERMNFITDNYDDSEKITLLYNSNSESNEDGTIQHMLDYLSSKDSRVESINIFSDSGEDRFVEQLNHIEQFAGNMEELEKIIA